MAKEKITTRAKDFSQWYIDVILSSQLADYAPVRGCMVIRPWGYAIWENMQRALDAMFKETGHQNAYFPLLIPESFMKKEAEHVEGFAPECAVVTHGGGKELEEPLMLRPTSETVIWDMYRRWISSHRDLPILINQWANVIRWEMRTRLFLRTTEFLWQEGHTAHATEPEAREETMKMLGVYRTFAEEWMAMPVIPGRKTENEKFAGAQETYSIEAMMQDGRALQSGTSHHLGQNFAKAFDVTFQDAEGKRDFVWATSWGVSTRLIGGLIMTHSDDDGLVLPPKLAPMHVVCVPIWKNDEQKSQVLEAAAKIVDEWRLANPTCRFHIDDRDQYKPGYKYNEWEMRGACIRAELGPKDIEKQQTVLVRRDKTADGKRRDKMFVPLTEAPTRIGAELDAMQKDLFNAAKSQLHDRTHTVDDYDEFKQRLESESGFFRLHWDGTSETENRLQAETKATIRCLPLGLDEEEGKCILTGNPSKGRVIVAKAY